MNQRRIFWGRSLPQAVAKAARYYRLAPEELAWRRHEKRHGFVKHPRAVLVEVDPDALRRTSRTPETPSSPAQGSPHETPPAAAPPAARAERTGPRREARASEARRPEASPRRAPARDAAPRSAASPSPRFEEAFDAPDEESEQAALEAIRRLLRFLALPVEASIARRDDRLELALAAGGPGSDPAQSEIGVELLDELEHLLPKAIFTLSGKRVRATVDFAGRREARAEELRAVATELAARVRASGAAETLAPLPPGERRIVHLLFESDPELTTESVGDGYRKRLRIVPRAR